MTEHVPSSGFDEDDSFEKRHTAKSRTTAGDLQKMETEGKATLKEKETTKRKTKTKQSSLEGYVSSHKRQLASVIFVMVMLATGVTATLLLSPSLLLVNIKENLVNDLSDGTKAYYAYSNKVLDMTASGGMGCNFDPKEPDIKCKFKTMSTYMRQNFTQHGFTLMPEEPPMFGNNNTAYSQLFTPPPPPKNVKQDPPARKGTQVVKDTYGHSISGKLSEAAEKDPVFRELLYRVFSPRTSLYQDRAFAKRLYDKFHIVRGTEIGGTTEEEVKKSFDNYVDTGSQSGDDYIDLNGQGNYGVAKLANSSSQWRNIMNNLIQDKGGQKVSSIATLACAYNTYARIAENSVVNARQTTVARYAMAFLMGADAIKAGLAEETPSMTLAGMLIKNSDTTKNATDASSYRTPAMFESAGQALRVNDPSLFLMMLNVPGSMMGTMKDTLLQRFASGIGITSPGGPDGIQGASSNDPYGWCTAGQKNPEKDNNEIKRVITWTFFGPMIDWFCYVHPQSLSTILGYGLNAVEAGVAEPIYYHPNHAQCELLEPLVTKTVATVLTPLVQAISDASFSVARSAAKSNIPYAASDPSSEYVQNAIFAGTGIILGDMAQSRGLKPVTMSDIPAFMQYLKEASVLDQQRTQDKVQLARAEPFNIYNRYSFAGIVAQNIFGGSATVSGPAGSASRFLGVLGSAASSVASVVNPSSSALFSQPLADSFDVSRLTTCPFNYNQSFWGKQGINIMADFGCNIRYYMPQSALNADLDSVLDYMTKDEQPTDVDWAQKSVDQLNQRSATGLDTARLAKLKQDAQEGASGAFVDKSGKPRPHTQYAKFLQYCVNRKNPWGAESVVYDPPKSSYVPNEQYYYGRDVFSSWEDPKQAGKGPEAPVSYYAIAAGPPIDQDWYTGKNCLKNNKMIDNFRAYTLACSVLAAMSGSFQCWEDDEKPYDIPDDFYLSNDILFLSNMSNSVGPSQQQVGTSP